VPTFGDWVATRRAHYPNNRAPWSQAEREQLAAEVAAGWSWQRIAQQHGRTVPAVVNRGQTDKLKRNVT
jgi:hypothetical protein